MALPKITEVQKQAHIDKITPLYQKCKAKVKTPILLSILLAQNIHESYFGTSDLYTKYNNVAGMKYKDPWKGRKINYASGEEIDGKWVEGVKSDFIWFDSIEQSIEYHTNFCQNTDWRKDVYEKALSATTYIGQAAGLTGTYATDSKYGAKLIKVIEDYDLTKYDKEDKNMSWTPNIVDRRKVSMGWNKYNGRPLKQITKAARHHTAGGLYQTMAIIEDWWRNGNKWDNGGYHVVIDGYGTVFINYDWDHTTWGVGYHNDYTVHVSLMGNGSFTAAQEKSYDWVMQKIFKELPQIKPSDVLGHNEFSGHTTNSCPGINMNTVRTRLAKLKDTPVVDPRFVDIPDYTSPTLPFKAMKVGEKVTIRPGQTAWYDPKTSEGLKPSKDFTGDKDTIMRVMDVNVGYSKRAYLLKDKVSWILEQDLEEPRVDWKPVEEVKPDEQDVGREENQFVVSGVLYEVNKVIK